MAKLRRDAKIIMSLIRDNCWVVKDKDDNVLISHEDDYFIYMVNVNLKNGNLITGRYLGDIAENSPLLDFHCKNVEIKNDAFYVDGVKIKTAKMVAVNNKKNIIIVISDK